MGTFTQVKEVNSMAAMGSLGRVGILSRRGVTLITKSTSCTTMLRQEHIMGNHTRTLVTSARRDERFFTKKHEWVEVDGGKGTVGISKYAADAPGDECGALESVKAASEVYSPMSGTVTEKNLVVEDGPALINQNAEEEGWLFKMDLTATEEVSALMNSAAYETYLKEECEDH